MKRNVYFFFKATSESKWSVIARKGYKHVCAIIYTGDTMLIVEPWGFNVFLRPIKVGKNDGADWIRRMASVNEVTSVVGCEVDAEAKPMDSQPFITLGLTCSEIVRLCTQVDVGRCWTPYLLYKRLHKLSGKRNFKIFWEA